MTDSPAISKITGGLTSLHAETETLRLARQAMGSDVLGKALRASEIDEKLRRAVLETNVTSFGMQASIAKALRLHEPYGGFGIGVGSSTLEKEIARSLALDRAGFGIGSQRGIGSVTEEVYRNLFGGFGSTVGDVLRGLEEQPATRDLASAQRKIMEHQARLFGTFPRATHWSDILADQKPTGFAELIGGGKAVNAQLDAVSKVAAELSAAQDALLGTRPRRSLEGMFGSTATKLSLFAGSIDVLGPSSLGSHAAFEALMGGYSAVSAPVEQRYWGKAAERARYYRDHDVDEGLIEADAAATVTTLIETGVADGGRTRHGTPKLIIVGDVRMEIIASRPKATAHAAIDAFEVELRQFIADRLEPVAGEKWFVQRVPGPIVTKAKEKRREAVRSGETQLSLIHYVDLGELLQIIVTGTNWKVFGPIFDRLEWLRTYLERLNALRRPVAHSRPFDTVQLVEVVTTIRTLTTWMQRDPDWQSGLDSDV